VGGAVLIAGSTGPLAASPRAIPDPAPERSLAPLAAPAQTPRSSTAGGEARPQPKPTPPPGPAVARLAPTGSSDDVSTTTMLSVSFDQPMDRPSTAGAVRVTVGGTAVRGAVRWEDGDRVLLFDPERDLPFGARVELSVAPGARSKAGAPLPQAASAAFSVEPRPAPTLDPAEPRSVARATPTPRPTPAPAGPRATPRPASAWQWPLIGPITQRFGESLTQYGYHQGIDINGDTGDPVRAARGGVVVVAGRYDDCSGLQVTIDHGNGLESWYRHLSDIDVTVGRRVGAGAGVGNVGDTGCSLGSHLHFAVRKNRTFVDPLRYLPPR
jgi:murein DD-endopeptidase MepM/ murein hydrolase activator NlpD